MARKAEPPKSWYRSLDKRIAEEKMVTIADELTARPDLLILLKEKAPSFIFWAGFERISYKPDLDEEVKDFLNKEFTTRRRMYNSNVKAWKALCKKVFIRDNYTCVYCGNVGGKLECDHIVPFSEGGSDLLENLTTACQKCNRQKYNKSVQEFKDWILKKSGI